MCCVFLFASHKIKLRKTVITGNHVLFNPPPPKKVVILSCLHGKIIVYSIKFLFNFFYTHTQRHTKVVKGKFALNHFSFWSLIFQYHEPVPSLWFFCLKHKGWIWYSYFRSKPSDCALKNTGKKEEKDGWKLFRFQISSKEPTYLHPTLPQTMTLRVTPSQKYIELV